jgi:cyclic pyranopterin phosphate synthase
MKGKVTSDPQLDPALSARLEQVRSNLTTTGAGKDFDHQFVSRSKDIGRENQPPAMGLSHVDVTGKATMVNVSMKSDTRRVAVASGRVHLGAHVFSLVTANSISKGDVLTVAKIAGIMGAKQTGDLIPLCHNLLLSGVDLSLSLNEGLHAVDIEAKVMTVGPTGVEMEALTAVSIASLTVYDMCKAVSKDIKISDIQLESKTGGKSGDWCREERSATSYP